MKSLGKYSLEFMLLGLVALLAITGFWNIYFGQDSKPTSYHHLHVIANFIWLFLLFFQLTLIGGNNYKTHRKRRPIRPCRCSFAGCIYGIVVRLLGTQRNDFRARRPLDCAERHSDLGTWLSHPAGIHSEKAQEATRQPTLEYNPSLYGNSSFLHTYQLCPWIQS